MIMDLKEEQNKFIDSIRQCDAMIYKICIMFTNRQIDNIKDLYQDIVCNLWNERKNFRNECDYKTWAYRIGQYGTIAKKCVKFKSINFAKDNKINEIKQN